MNTRKILSCAIAVLFALTFVACNDGSDTGDGDGSIPSALVGKWYSKADPDMLMFEITSAGKITLNSANNDTLDLTVSGGTGELKSGSTNVGTFDYSISNGELSITNATGVMIPYTLLSPLIKKGGSNPGGGNDGGVDIPVTPGGGDDGGGDNPVTPGGGDNGGGDNPVTPGGGGTPGLAYELIESYEGPNAGTYRVRRGTVISGSVIIPATHNGLPVTEIGREGEWYENGAFGATNITSVYIPASVKIIGSFAFGWCNSLTTITFAEGSQLEAISTGAFYKMGGGSGLTSITIPASVKTIGSLATNDPNDRVFEYFTNVTFAAGSRLESIGNYAFCYSDITNITLPEGVTTIGNYAFYGCTSTSINIPASVTSIGNGAFDGCTNLASITIPASITSIGYNTFYDCTSLTSITIPANITTIGGDAFAHCTSLRNVIIDTDQVATTSSNNWGTRFPADNLSVTFKKDVGDYAFYNCSRLTSVTIKESVTSIGDRAFSGCTGLANITIGEGVTSIGDSAFSGCTGLTSVTIPEDATTIGDSAFSGCTGLTGIAVPADVTSIGDRAFSGCTGLASITVAANNPNYASEDGILFNKAKTTLIQAPAKITDVTISAIVTSISDWAFSDCTILRNITIDTDQVATNITNWGERFSADNLSVTFKKNVGDYAFRYCTRLTSVTIEEGVTSIGGNAFFGCTGLTGITIPESVTSIGNSAFNGCTGLTGSITIPDGVPSIEQSTFRSCRSLTGITIGAGVTSIGLYAFQNCTNLRNIIIDTDQVANTASSNWGAVFPADNLSVTFKKNTGNYAFELCTRLTSVTIEEGVTSIGQFAFMDCTGLTNVTISSSVRTIGSGAFNRCTSLASVTIEEGVITIGSYAFNNCDSLTSITIPASVTTIGQEAFRECPKLTSVTLNCTIADSTLAWPAVTFPGNLRTKYFGIGGGIGRYTRTGYGTTIDPYVWTKQA